MATYRTGLTRFFGNQQARIEARLRKPFRTYPGTGATPLSPRNWWDIMEMNDMELPSDYVNRGELVAAADFQFRR
jgi:hypothetical protein